ncbi:MAG: hypothetical protein CMF70_02150 [Magnetovibrio sp.]|nr:hypothetical protein [Magnetovibrio sp.]
MSQCRNRIWLRQTSNNGSLYFSSRQIRKKKHFSRILDLGCGSGILSIAAAKLWKTRVFAADIDPEAIRVTSYNVKLNGVSHLVSSIPSSTNPLSSTRDHGPYDLIVANILTVPLITMSQTLLTQLLPQGIIVVSGFLTKDGNRLLNAFCSRHTKVLYKKTRDGWMVIALKNSRNLQNYT